MSITNFLHGVRTVEYDDGTKEISTVDVSVIGIVGTAPRAAGAARASYLWGSELADNLVLFSANLPGSSGNSWVIEIKDGTNSQIVPGYSTLPDGSQKLTLFTDATMTPQKLGQQALELRSGRGAEWIGVYAVNDDPGAGIVSTMPETRLSGGADEPFPYNIPSLIVGSRVRAAKLDTGGGGDNCGTLPAAISDILNQGDALIVVVRVEDTDDSELVQQRIISGIKELEKSVQFTGIKPRILIAPDYSANDAVAAQLEVTTNKLRGVGYIDSPGAAKPSDVVKRRQKYGGRMEMLRPRIFSTSDLGAVSRPYSAAAAGLRARIDNERGWWWSKSNQNIYGITGLEQIDDFEIGETSCTTNLLNASQVSTIIRYDGWRHWGNYLCSLDPQWSFECVRRTADVIEDSIAIAMMNNFIDRPIDAHLGEDIIETINAYIRQLYELGAINGGKAWLDSELNTKESLAAGKLYINVEFAPKSPAQTITIIYRINNDYTVDEFASLFKEAA
ncbi:phage tail sheath C-terminal domain-containing protein [Escherichia fergusonii]|uniref:phage tail sheath C-terminal domain-containing protein n=1 Tax=Escherichia fergusonii TaxID=564 RepID=UPI0020CD5987|nr:phage tail sheath C-terminal domain-containing protein [Escherichia fergusonii]MCP9660862.1 phage tail sheath subtilisin-like domain-containing protein [Escherichia fergusonii]